MWCGAGIGAPLSCLRRLPGNAGSMPASFGEDGVPPGMRYPSASKRCTDSGFAVMNSRALASISSGVAATSSTRPTPTASAGLYR